MYKFATANKNVEKRLRTYLERFPAIRNKLDRLKLNPRKEIGAHPLHGRLAGKWSCWLGANIRVIYSIHDDIKTIIIEAVGSHKIY